MAPAPTDTWHQSTRPKRPAGRRGAAGPAQEMAPVPAKRDPRFCLPNPSSDTLATACCRRRMFFSPRRRPARPAPCTKPASRAPASNQRPSQRPRPLIGLRGTHVGWVSTGKPKRPAARPKAKPSRRAPPRRRSAHVYLFDAYVCMKPNSTEGPQGGTGASSGRSERDRGLGVASTSHGKPRKCGRRKQNVCGSGKEGGRRSLRDRPSPLCLVMREPAGPGDRDRAPSSKITHTGFDMPRPGGFSRSGLKGAHISTIEFDRI